MQPTLEQIENLEELKIIDIANGKPIIDQNNSPLINNVFFLICMYIFIMTIYIMSILLYVV